MIKKQKPLKFLIQAIKLALQSIVISLFLFENMLTSYITMESKFIPIVSLHMSLHLTFFVFTGHCHVSCHALKITALVSFNYLHTRSLSIIGEKFSSYPKTWYLFPKFKWALNNPECTVIFSHIILPFSAAMVSKFLMPPLPSNNISSVFTLGIYS